MSLSESLSERQLPSVESKRAWQAPKREFLIDTPDLVCLTDPKKGAPINQDSAGTVTVGDWRIMVVADGNPGETNNLARSRAAADVAVSIALLESTRAIEKDNDPDKKGDLFPAIAHLFTQQQQEWKLGETTLALAAYNKRESKLKGRSIGSTLIWLYDPRQRNLLQLSTPPLDLQNRLLVQSEYPEDYSLIMNALTTANNKQTALDMVKRPPGHIDKEKLRAMMNVAWENRENCALLSASQLNHVSHYDLDGVPSKAVIMIPTDGAMGMENLPISFGTGKITQDYRRGRLDLRKTATDIIKARHVPILNPDARRSEDDATILLGLT